MKQKLTAWLLLLTLLSGCAASGGASEEASLTDTALSQYETTIYDLFDTTTVIKGYAKSEEAFREQADFFAREMGIWHRLFDIYNDYDGVVNVKTINDNAGIAPVEADEKLITFLRYCEEMYEVTHGKVDITLGAVLYLWHTERENGIVHPDEAAAPDEDALREAATHTGWDLLEIDEEAQTVYLTDSKARLDVGAIGKGYAVERVAREMPAGYLISVGGNVCATGPKAPDNAPWVVGVRDPDGARNEFVHTLYLTNGAVVSSGDYERYYTVGDTRYHHIIDPETLYPATNWRGVSVIHEDSGLADALSTAVFLMDFEEAKALLEANGAEGCFVDANGQIFYTDGFAAYIRT